MASGAFSNFRAGLPYPAEGFGIGIGLLESLIFGLSGLANRQALAQGFGVPMLPAAAVQQHPGALQQTAEEEERARRLQKTQDAYLTAIAARNLQNGVVILTFATYLRDRKALGIAVFAGLITTVTDTWIIYCQGPEARSAIWGHCFGIFNCLAIGGSLLYWGRGDKLF